VGLQGPPFFLPSRDHYDINAGATFGQELKSRDPRIIQLGGKFYL